VLPSADRAAVVARRQFNQLEQAEPPIKDLRAAAAARQIKQLLAVEVLAVSVVTQASVLADLRGLAFLPVLLELL
jgi:hypothetical protein